MITHGLCTGAKRDFLAGVHQPGDRYMVALYGEGASLDPSVAAYTSQGEVEGQGYKRGGMVLRNPRSWADDEHGYLTFDAARWTNATLTAYGAMIYNASKGNKAVAVLDFGGAYSSTAGDFLFTPPADAIAFL